MAKTAPIPSDSVLVETQLDPQSGREVPTGIISNAWYEYFLQAQDRLNAGADTLTTVFDSVINQSAAIPTTSIPLTTLSVGLYRVSTYARITQAASTSSSLTVTLGWEDGTVACTSSGSALTGNTTATTGSQSVVIRSDADGSVTYATAYSSSGGTAMQYRLDIVLEQLST